MKGKMTEKVREALQLADWSAVDVVGDMYRCIEETAETGMLVEMDDELLEQFKRRLQDLVDAVSEERSEWK